MIADKVPDIKHTPPPKKKTDKDYDDAGTVPPPEFEKVDEMEKETIERDKKQEESRSHRCTNGS